MSDTTTIQLRESTKERLDKRKHENESYDTAVNRILDGNPGVLFEQADIEHIAATKIKSMVVDDALE